jgi:hypothetical protein
VAKIHALLLEGHSIPEIREACASAFPKHDCQALLELAAKPFLEYSREPEDLVRGWCLGAARDLYRKLNSVGAYADALRAVKLIADVAAKNAPAASGAIEI